MKLLRANKKAAAPSTPDVSMATDEAVYKPGEDAKSKKKKFGLFSKKKKKSTPQTPDTVTSADGEILNLSGDHGVKVFPVGKASPPGKTEKELKETLTWARSLLAELDMADTDAGPDGEAEGMELILPGTKYEVVEEKKEKVEQAAVEETVENEGQAPSEEKPAEEEAVEDTTAKEEETPTEETEAVVVEEKKDEEPDLRNTSMVAEEEEGEVDQQQQPELQQPQSAAANAAAKILSAAFACTGQDAEKCAEALYKNAMAARRNHVDLDNMFEEKTGSEFLHDMTNVGYTLIYHIAVDEESWVGRTVSLVFRPGMCNSEKIVQPVIEWNTMAGGKSNTTDTKSVKLLNIDSIAPSNAHEGEESYSLPIPAKPPSNPKNDVSIGMCNLQFPPVSPGEEFDCFFTITSQDGEIHLFEALNSEDSMRIVAGIRYSAQRLSRSLIEGDANVLLSDYYDNSNATEESKLPENEVMNKLSNAFLDGQ